MHSGSLPFGGFHVCIDQRCAKVSVSPFCWGICWLSLLHQALLIILLFIFLKLMCGLGVLSMPIQDIVLWPLSYENSIILSIFAFENE